MTSDDSRLVRAAQEDPSAFAPLYERYVDRVYGYLRSRTACGEDAADLTQQVFLQALKALRRYKPGPVPFSAWLFRIARNLAVDFHRRRPPAIAWDHLPEALQPASGEDVTRDIERWDAAARVRDLFATLDDDSREILMLRFGAELTVTEIASVMGKSPAATRMRLVRTLRAMKEQYDGQLR